MTIDLPQELIDQFWSFVTKSESCWEWKGQKTANGYGRFRFTLNGDRFALRAHRLSYELAYGSIPEGLMICHHCDNRPCVRPDHLFTGTAKDNAQDASRKGRLSGRVGTGSPGEECFFAKLTTNQVREIRALYVPRKCGLKELGRRYNTHWMNIWHIIQRRTWKHVV